MRTTLLVVVLLVAVLATGSYVSARSGGSAARAGVTLVNGSNVYSLGDGTCQTVGKDFSVSLVDKNAYFHLIWTPKAHGNYRTVDWRYSYLFRGTIFGAKMRFASGRKSGTFSGVTTDGARITGSFGCG